jgi:membrane dipeptidase
MLNKIKKNQIFDLHLDLEVYFNPRLRKILNFKYSKIDKLEKNRHFDLVQAKKVNLKYAVVQIQAIYLKKNKLEPLLNFKEALYNLENFKKKAGKFFKIISKKSDLDELNNKIGIILGFEGLNFVSNIKDLEILWKSGIRVFGLCWNFENKICGGLWSNKAISSFGRKSIDFLNKLNAIIDLAHANEISQLEAIKIAKNFIFSHNNIRKVSDFNQNISDKVLKNLKNKKTLIGLTLLPKALKPENSFNSFLKNYKFLYKENKNIVAIGSDFFGFDFESSPKGAKNYVEFYKNLLKHKVNISKLFDNTYKFFYNIISTW